jgi:ribulose-phosphate 3-epimerase
MAIVCPTVTAFNLHEYRSQVELLEPFAQRLHIDLMDGEFAPTRSPDLDTIWWPDQLTADIHLMYQQPTPYLQQLIVLKPALVIIHAEAEVNHTDFAAQLQANGIKAGLGLLQDTAVADVLSLLANFDHVMIFSGNLGHHGGSTADVSHLHKVRAIREKYPTIEIAWDGGITDQNAKQLVSGGIDVLNVGGFIHKASNPQAAYAKLEAVIGTA